MGKHGTKAAMISANIVASGKGGSLPVRIELLVLTCTKHRPERNRGDMREAVTQGVIKHLHT